MDKTTIHVEIAFGDAEHQHLLAFTLPDGSTVYDAMHAAGLSLGNKLGIFGKMVSAKTPLKDNDRIEIYRALLIDPKEARRQKAFKDKRQK